MKEVKHFLRGAVEAPDFRTMKEVQHFLRSAVEAPDFRPGSPRL